MLSGRWQRALDAHRAAADRYLQTLDQLDDGSWLTPRAPGKWSPAHVTQHLILYYRAADQVLRGELTLRYRVGPAWRTVLRWFLLPHVLFRRSFPLRATAPRELRPEGPPPLRREAAELLRAAVAEAERTLARAAEGPVRKVRHPYFGELTPLRFVRLSAVHFDHHRAQVEQAARGLNSRGFR